MRGGIFVEQPIRLRGFASDRAPVLAFPDADVAFGDLGNLIHAQRMSFSNGSGGLGSSLQRAGIDVLDWQVGQELSDLLSLPTPVFVQRQINAAPLQNVRDLDIGIGRAVSDKQQLSGSHAAICRSAFPG